MLTLWYILRTLGWVEMALLACIAVGCFSDYMPHELADKLVKWLGGGENHGDDV